MAATATPPLPPDVTDQQGPPLEKFAQGAMKQGGAPGGMGGQQNSLEFVKETFKKIGELMTQAAQVISVEKPAMMPLIVRMASVGAAIEKQLQTEAQGQGKPKAGPEPQQGAPQGGPPAEGQASLGI